MKTVKTVKRVKTVTVWCAVYSGAGDAFLLGYGPALMGEGIPKFRGILDQLRDYQLLRTTYTHVFMKSLFAM
jgi:hypothetical protein